ncbi:MAG: hypothetical protein V1658_01585, partial [Candidatus Micrarchaeota archaeon]
VRMAYHVFLQTPANGSPHRVIEVDHLGLRPENLRTLDSSLWKLIGAVDYEHRKFGKLSQISLSDTWLLSHPRFYNFFKRRAESRGFHLTPKGGALNEEGFYNALKRGMVRYKARARAYAETPELLDRAMAYERPLLQAVRIHDSASVLKNLSRMTKTLSVNLTREIFPDLFKTYYVTPKKE